MAKFPFHVTSKTELSCIRCGKSTHDRIGAPTPEYPMQAMCKPCQKLALKDGPHQRLRSYWTDQGS